MEKLNKSLKSSFPLFLALPTILVGRNAHPPQGMRFAFFPAFANRDKKFLGRPPQNFSNGRQGPRHHCPEDKQISGPFATHRVIRRSLHAVD